MGGGSNARRGAGMMAPMTTSDLSGRSEPVDLPPLPETVAVEHLKELAPEALDLVEERLRTAELLTVSAMSPYERSLREIRARLAEIATERRRQERSARHAARIAVREAAGSGAMPALTEALDAPDLALADDHPLRELRAYLRTGGQVGLGYPNRPGSITFTDGRRTLQATTVGEARRLWRDGWEPGTPGLTGIRVHLAGTRVERLAPLDEVVIEIGDETTEGAGDSTQEV